MYVSLGVLDLARWTPVDKMLPGHRWRYSDEVPWDLTFVVFT